MNKKEFNRYPLAFIILLILAQSVFLSSNTDLKYSRLESDIALAAENQTEIVYLPIIHSRSILPTIFGVQMRKISSQYGFDEMVRAESHWVRRNGILWSEVEEVKGEYDWDVLAEMEDELVKASNVGMEVILVVRSTPTWAQQVEGMYCGPIKETELDTFAKFMGEVVSRYSAPPYSVKYWEIWNEPDIDPILRKNTPKSQFGCWGDKDDEFYGGGYYADMLKKVHPEIKAADPDAQVVLGGLLLDCDPRLEGACDSAVHKEKPSLFLEGILKNGGGAYFEGISFHAYDYYSGSLGLYSGPLGWGTAWNTTGPVLSSKADFIQGVLENYGVSGKYLMNTESALIYDGNCDQDCETTKAYYLVQNYASAIRDGLLANIWFSVYGWRNSELLELDGTPLPAYTAFKFAASELKDAFFVREINNYSAQKVKVLEFNRGDRRIWVMWSMNDNPQSIDLPGMPLAVWDPLGNPVTPSDPVDIDKMPLYLEWNP